MMGLGFVRRGRVGESEGVHLGEDVEEAEDEVSSVREPISDDDDEEESVLRVLYMGQGTVVEGCARVERWVDERRLAMPRTVDASVELEDWATGARLASRGGVGGICIWALSLRALPAFVTRSTALALVLASWILLDMNGAKRAQAWCSSKRRS